MREKTVNAAANPLLAEWTTPYGTPPFGEIAPGLFAPAFDVALKHHEAEIAAIAGDGAAADFANTIEAMERAGLLLQKVAMVFFNLAGAETSDKVQTIEREIVPRLERHRSGIYQNEKLFARVDAVWRTRDALDLTPEQRQVLDRTHTRFVRAGAALDAESKKRLAEIGERLALLGTRFAQNVLKDESSWSLVLDGADDLSGLPDFAVAAAAQAAEERGLKGKHVITLSRSSIEPFLTFSSRRDLREEAWTAWMKRGENAGDTDNRGIAKEMIALRAEYARLMGYESFADYKLADSMAGTPDAALSLMRRVWEPARRQALAEQDALQRLVEAQGSNFRLAPWDWRHYAEKRRREAFDLDEAEIKPYFHLDRVIEAAFDTAHRLFGLTFTEQEDVPVYHPDVRAWDVRDADGAHIGLFLGDYFARSSKRSGAWMSAYRAQEKLCGDVRPIIVNVMSFSKGSPCLLSFDDARTLFHEFGHALHGLLSDVTYPSISGTGVLRDFVEFPSQLYEHWLDRPEVLKRFAVHYRTGEPMPEELLKRVLAARNFNQGFATVEYLASALYDMELHRSGGAGDAAGLEGRVMDEIGMPEAMVMRHRPAHFAHVFAGDGYAAGYYSYLWSEVLSADGFAAFEESGDVFDRQCAKRLREHVLSAGFSSPPDVAYRAFRGRKPEPAALLKRRGLVEMSAEAEM
ncbi:MAG: M3 family metallopeptidase [Pseudomonadota bacterium]|nr:M3 family metallopeptidase [Pseudomonadota bacterium]